MGKLRIAKGKMWSGTMWILFPIASHNDFSPSECYPIVPIYPFFTSILLSFNLIFSHSTFLRFFFLLIFSLLIKFPASLLYISTTYFSFAHVRSLCVSFKHSFTKFFLHWGFSSLVLMYYFWLISSLKPLLSFFFHFSHSHAGENKFTFS